MREYRKVLNIPLNTTTSLFLEMFYADDTDMITNSLLNDSNILQLLKEVLAIFNLKINVNKTEIINITSKGAKDINTRKLGSSIGDHADVTRRTNAANTAFNMMWSVWRNKHIKRNTKVKLYKACILPVLLYNLAANSATNTVISKLDTTLRKHIRHICYAYYPNVMHNSTIYELLNMSPVCVLVVEQRWRFLGHLLRLPENTPAFQLMQYYYQPLAAKVPQTGYQLGTTIPNLISREASKYLAARFLTPLDVYHFRQLARNRTTWSGMVEKIKNQALAEYTKEQEKKKKKASVKKRAMVDIDT